tara:strand:+ start:92898 stop:93464 length:567 start_codon:yes stop_codon:yes gene_type:complete
MPGDGNRVPVTAGEEPTTDIMPRSAEARRCTPTKQPSTPNLDFEKAETYFQQVFLPFKFHVPLTTLKLAHEGNRHITGLAHNARAKFQAVREQLNVAGVDRAYWDIAVEVRIGEIRNLLGEKLSAMPVRLPPAAPNTMSFEWSELHGPRWAGMKEEARSHWEAAAARGQDLCIDSEWTQLAEQHLSRL